MSSNCSVLRLLFLAVALLSLTIPQVVGAPPKSLESPSTRTSGQLWASEREGPKAPILRKRALRQNLPDGWVLHFHTFSPFAPSRLVALMLSHFWSEMALQLSNKAWMPDDQFQSKELSLHMPLQPGDPEYGQMLDLSFEIFSTAGPVTRKVASAVAVTMMERTLRGFYGSFNARLAKEGVETYFIIMRVKGLSELIALHSGVT